jgi:hypothetical protein
MERLRSRYLNVPLIAALHPASLSAQRAATEQKAAANAAPAVQEEELTAQQWFERGFAATDVDEKLRFYTEAIRLKTDYALAFNNRGVARSDKGDVEGGARLCRSKGACSSARPPKLNPEQEQLVRSLLNKGKSVRDLAKTFHVHIATIYRLSAAGA